jgi:hypothetical protein
MVEDGLSRARQAGGLDGHVGVRTPDDHDPWSRPDCCHDLASRKSPVRSDPIIAGSMPIGNQNARMERRPGFLPPIGPGGGIPRSRCHRLRRKNPIGNLRLFAFSLFV